jgi:excinuclease ABC subunit C
MIETLRNLPDAPGVYQYFDREGRLLYVGKAKSLKKRVKSYFRFTPRLAPAPNLSPRIYRMIAQTARLETVVTPTESDALLLENSLIKQLKPKYNILLRDDKTYPYLYIDLAEPFPRPALTRKVVKGKKVRYFGPFPHGARAILDSIYELVPLVQKGGSLKNKRACLFYQIGRCKAPCEGKIDPQSYARLVEEAIGYIKDKRRLLEALRAKMARYAESLRFEEAAALRDRIETIEKSESVHTADMARNEDLDLFAFAHDGERGVMVRLFIRDGKVAASSHSWITSPEIDDPSPLYRQTILDFYPQEPPLTARSIITAHPFDDSEELSQLLSRRFGKKVRIDTPRRGIKRRLADLGIQNACELLRQKAQERPDRSIETAIAELLGLETPPERIEAFDNSHLMGESPVGAMVVYNRGEWDKAAYRRYALEGRDEYAQMRAMLTRRIEKFAQEPPPDLWVLDGGETLRALAERLLAEAGVNLPVVAIAKEKIDAKAHRAKGAAKDLIYTGTDILRLAPGDKRLQWFQRLRDEAHRYVLAYHKKRRLAKEKRISLLEAPGIGPAKIKKLLDYFGSFEAIKSADKASLCAVLSERDANSLYAKLHGEPTQNS